MPKWKRVFFEMEGRYAQSMILYRILKSSENFLSDSVVKTKIPIIMITLKSIFVNSQESVQLLDLIRKYTSIFMQ